ncbi:MAG: radical SAM family heme chaperone HemW [Hyphomonadaceae bacterium]|nr:radical SAM family heme chaperone HemW [Hyphomonadaceae bacterium]
MTGPALGLYVHWPYCAAICPYCDFNVRRDRGGDHAALIAAIETDILAHAGRVERRPLSSVFFGGGTPSRLASQDVARLIAAANRAFGVSADAEISLEANPEDYEAFAAMAAAGVNRFSLGVQALDDAALRRLGRTHDVAGAHRAIAAAAQTGARVSIDLIYAREGQTWTAWTRELRAALAAPVAHVSLYELTIEPRTPYARAAARGRYAPLSPDDAATLFARTHALCASAGFPAYEISNFARTLADRARHNLLYWRSETWIGVGPGAHGRLLHGDTRLATAAHRDIAAYIGATAEHGVGWSTSETLTRTAFADEMLLMGLRLREGVSRAAVETMRGAPLDPTRLAALVNEGIVSVAGDRIALSEQGLIVADRVAAELSA